MKYYFKVFVLTFTLINFLFIQFCFSQEQEGFVKRSWRNILGIIKKPAEEKPKPPAQETQKTPTETKASKEVAPLPELPVPEEETTIKLTDTFTPEDETQEEPKKSPLMEMTNEALIERIKYMILISMEAVDFIPELKVETDKDGNVIMVKYKVSGIFEDINNLDKETLIKIHNRVNNERVRIQTERIQQQLQAARAGQNIPRPPQQVYIPPSVPQPPKLPPTPPKTPQPPPAPPQVPRR